MTFNKCSIRGKLYGYITDESGNEIQDPEILVIIIIILNLFLDNCFLLFRKKKQLNSKNKMKIFNGMIQNYLMLYKIMKKMN